MPILLSLIVIYCQPLNHVMTAEGLLSSLVTSVHSCLLRDKSYESAPLSGDPVEQYKYKTLFYLE